MIRVMNDYDPDTGTFAPRSAALDAHRSEQYELGQPDAEHGAASADPGSRLKRALGYPYPQARWSDFLLDHGAVKPLPAGYSMAGRLPVLAVGSNRSPVQLVRKYGHGAQIPVTAFELADHDVAYCAYMTHYGSIPATLIPAPGHRAQLAVTWLTAAQLARMHETEAVGTHTHFGWIGESSRPLTSDDPSAWHCTQPGAVLTYLSARGLLDHDGQPVVLAEVQATGRGSRNLQNPALGQRDVLEQVWHRANARTTHSTHPSLDSWLLTHIEDSGLRDDLNDLLQNTAISLLPDSFVPIEQIETLMD